MIASQPGLQQGQVVQLPLGKTLFLINIRISKQYALYEHNYFCEKKHMNNVFLFIIHLFIHNYIYL